MEFETVIGLEVHAELTTRSKLFCGCPNRFGAEPNTQVCPICLGLPGVLPVVNRRAVELHALVARATDCRLAPFSKFDRKNYFYPDMPKNFQTSQYDLPLGAHGRLEVVLDSGERKVIGITRIHLEEDTGKSVHLKEADGELVPGRLGGSDLTLVDYNRAGVPLLEIVSEPEIRTSEEAVAYLVALRDILVWLKISDGRMEEGSLRCDANISLRPPGQAELGTKTEIKNMNSFKSVKAALEYEATRQAEVLRSGGRIIQETRGWDEARQVTISMRSKEQAHDYRYFPEPDLPPMELDETWLAPVMEELVELPMPRSARFVKDHGLGPKEAALMVSTRANADMFEATVGAGAPAREVANWLANEVSRLAYERALSLLDSGLTPAILARILELVASGAISHRGGRETLGELYAAGGDVDATVARLGLAQISDASALLAMVREVVEANPVPVAEFRAGKAKARNVLVGQIMKRTQGRANPAELNRLLTQVLEA